jgi:hypothetical protein
MAIIIVFALLAILAALAAANVNTIRRLHDELRLVEKRQLRKFQITTPVENDKKSATVKTNVIPVIPQSQKHPSP